MLFEVDFISAGGAILTWNPADKSANMSLANGDLDAISLQNNTYEGVRATLSKNTGKWYVAYKLIDTRVADDIYVGLRVFTATWPNTNPFGDATYRILWRAGSGQIFGGSTTPGGMSFGIGDVAEIAVDTDTGKFWCRINGGTWKGGGDPSTDTTPTETYATGGDTVYPVHVTDNAPAHSDYNVRLQGNASNQDDAAPSGFTPWGD